MSIPPPDQPPPSGFGYGQQPPQHAGPPAYGQPAPPPYGMPAPGNAAPPPPPRRSPLVPIIIAAGLLVIVAGIVVAVVVIGGILRQIAGSEGTGSAGGSGTAGTAAAPANMPSDGILFEKKGSAAAPRVSDGRKAGTAPTPTSWPGDDGVAHVITYVDWSCPACGQFEQTYSAELRSQVAAGTATLEVHPIAILDSRYPGGDRYSTRAANAAACVAAFAPSEFLDVQDVVFASQPTEGSAGLSDDRLIALVAQGGATTPSVTSCIRTHRYASWVGEATARATQTITSTPTVLIGDDQWDHVQPIPEFLADHQH